MNASRFTIQLKALTTTFLLDLLFSISLNNCLCLSPVSDMSHPSLPWFSDHSAACWGHPKLCLFTLLPSYSCSLVRLEEDRSSEPICLWQHQRTQRKSNPCRRQPPPAARSHAQPIPKKAPKAPGWVSMASGVDGASTVVPYPQIGEGYHLASFFCNA